MRRPAALIAVAVAALIAVSPTVAQTVAEETLPGMVLRPDKAAKPPATKAEWQAAVGSAIQRNTAPPQVEVNGDTTLRVVVRRDGTLAEVVVDKSSGTPALDEAAVRAVRRSEPLPALLPDMAGEQVTLKIPFRFTEMDLKPQGKAARAPTQPVRDPKTGLTVRPPVRLMARLGRPRGDFAAVIEVVSPSGHIPSANTDGTLCSIAFTPIADYAGMDQATLDARLTDPAFVAAAGEPFALFGKVVSVTPFRDPGHAGLVLVIEPGLGPNAGDARMHVALWDAPQGRFLVSCATSAAALPQAEATFAKLRAAVTLEP